MEEQLHKMFPQARVLRMDADTTRTRESYEKILAAFARGDADILVGTQMIVKGHDFPAVTLVGVLAAEDVYKRQVRNTQGQLLSLLR